MPTPQTIALFLAAAVLLVIIPGPNVLYIVARSVHQGRAAGVVSALGMQVGTLLHVAAATLGLSALLVSSASAFLVVKYAGAAYLLYLGLRTLLGRDHPAHAAAPAPVPPVRVFRQAVLVNALNPKTALFFLTFLPQFVDPARGNVAAQTFVLGALLGLVGLVNDLAYVLAAGGLGAWLKGSARFRATERWVTASVYLGLGLTTALAGQDNRD